MMVHPDTCSTIQGPDFGPYLGADQSMAAWLDQGSETAFRKQVDLPFLRLPESVN